MHSFLELVPLLAVTVISLLYCPQFKALVGLRIGPDRKLFQKKRDPVSPTYVATAHLRRLEPRNVAHP